MQQCRGTSAGLRRVVIVGFNINVESFVTSDFLGTL